jgi:ankyrin repeat protein
MSTPSTPLSEEPVQSSPLLFEKEFLAHFEDNLNYFSDESKLENLGITTSNFSDESKLKLLVIAAAAGKEAVFKKLLNSVDLITAKTSDGSNIMHIAAGYSSDDTVTNLVNFSGSKKSCDLKPLVWVLNQDVQSPFHIAAKKSSTTTLEVLHEITKLDPNKTDSKFVKFINRRDNNGQTAYDLALQAGSATGYYLIKIGATRSPSSTPSQTQGNPMQKNTDRCMVQ